MAADEPIIPDEPQTAGEAAAGMFANAQIEALYWAMVLAGEKIDDEGVYELAIALHDKIARELQGDKPDDAEIGAEGFRKLARRVAGEVLRILAVEVRT